MTFLTRKHLPRRTVLRGLGVSVALPLLDAMIPAATALAQTAARPKSRLSCIYIPHGATMDLWTPKEVGRDFAFSQILRPFEPFRDSVTVISNLAHRNVAPASGEDTGGAENHSRAAAVFLTGAHPFKGDMARVKILDVDVEKERISLGIKQLSDDPFAAAASQHKKGDVVTSTVSAVQENGIEVSLGDGVTGFIRKADLSRERSEQRPDRFAIGEKVDAKITAIDAKTRKLTLSIKAREVDEEKQAMADYGSSDSGASLGDILGAALSKAQKSKAEAAEAKGKKKGGSDEAGEQAKS